MTDKRGYLIKFEWIKPQYITNAKGKKIAVVIPLDEYAHIIEQLEMLADIRAYDKAKAVNEPSVPYKKAISHRKDIYE